MNFFLLTTFLILWAVQHRMTKIEIKKNGIFVLGSWITVPVYSSFILLFDGK
jgi:hypothetical protein